MGSAAPLGGSEQLLSTAVASMVCRFFVFILRFDLFIYFQREGKGGRETSMCERNTAHWGVPGPETFQFADWRSEPQQPGPWDAGFLTDDRGASGRPTLGMVVDTEA